MKIDLNKYGGTLIFECNIKPEDIQHLKEDNTFLNNNFGGLGMHKLF